jgi:hypothetical protein
MGSFSWRPRIFADPTDPKDVDRVHALQDAVEISQRGGPGRFEFPIGTRPARRKSTTQFGRSGESDPDLRPAFGSTAQVDPVRHLIGTASVSGGNPDEDAIDLNVTPDKQASRAGLMPRQACGTTPQAILRWPLWRQTSLLGGASVCATLQRGQSGTPGEHCDARGFEPGGPGQPSSLGPQRQGVSRLNKPAECLEGRHRLQGY